ncbi:hypothetical protein AYO42_05630 [Rhizomicrobium sp. SCGC AG-212-E05]|nr:hypothetical protein AYO42_05630 [Rhizomicrobium sp. SCGC AG-212-E05]
MLLRPGGISRDQALQGANANIRAHGADSAAEVANAIAAIAAIAARSSNGRMSSAEMEKILEQGDHIVSLAGTFGYDHLERAARALCDITYGLVRTGCGDAAPIHVHVMALQVFSPAAPTPSDAEAERVLSELKTVMTFYQFGPIGSLAN